MKNDLRVLESDNFVLSQKIIKEGEKMKAIQKENLLISTEYEIEDERQFNLERAQKGGKQAIIEAKKRRLRSASLPPTSMEIRERSSSLRSPRYPVTKGMFT